MTRVVGAPRRQAGRGPRAASGVVLLGVLLLAGLAALPLPANGAAGRSQGGSEARVVHDLAPVYAGPGTEYEVVWRLYEGTLVAVAGEGRGTDERPWWRVRLWNSEDGWVPLETLSFEPFPARQPPGEAAGAGGGGGGPCQPRPEPAPRPPTLLSAWAVASRDAAPADTADGDGGTTRVAAGTRVGVDAWTVGADGRVRYHVVADGQMGWVVAGDVRLEAADPVTRTVAGRPVAEPLRGQGIWFTLDSREHGAAAAERVARAARASGLSHLYVEVATSRGGFWGSRWLDELLPAARASGVRVIGSVYACLDDLPGDLALAREVARYRTRGGLGLDGLTVDLEEMLVPENVQAYGELLRHDVGDDYLLIATVYPPESWYAPRYPWPALAASWNAVVPMAYWRFMANRPFTAAEVYAYTRRNLAQTRTLAGRSDLPVQMLAQLFDAGRPRLLGPDGPTPAEIAAAAAAARDEGAVGISYWDWTRATPAQWAAIAAVSW